MALGARVEFSQVDVSQAEQVRALIAGIESECGGLHGIVHSAGVLRDSFVVKKTAEELAQVLAPKVAGLVNLDEASRECGGLDASSCSPRRAGRWATWGRRTTRRVTRSWTRMRSTVMAWWKRGSGVGGRCR